MTTRKHLFLSLALSLAIGSGSPGESWAAKPSVSLERCVKRAKLVVTAEIKSEKVIRKPERDFNGNWLPMRGRVSARIRNVLKNGLEKGIREDILFDCDGLTFEEGRVFVLFLDEKGSDEMRGSGEGEVAEFDCLPAPTIAIEATRGNVDRIRRIIAR